ncbi:MAG TPA: hypothetical protein DEO94_01425 [Cyanobacteria bacterium UBA11991]|nr:hypothetical protein [Cyanobacteriota bacterium]MDY6358256.1 hypothetical protein [Cyanobacteriota bacterium]MDY6363822.1 hypothetical protein [Cyanobacteriota bacterium]MDY6382354.1 hypothetical protein [Cyanobacteriota bacterium]HCB10818.1 hypothetical protein [Cyanobacteria bacterium UBA11991]
MDKEKLRQFAVPIILVAVAFLAFLKLGMGIYTNVTEIMNQKQTYETKSQELKENKAKLEKIRRQKAEEARKMAALEANSKPFYKPVISGMDTEAVIAGEFAEILQLIRANRIKVRSIKYDYDPQDDNFVKNAGSTYKVARLNMEMIANYMNFNNFMKELYKHEHFLDIQSVEIVPYRKNKQILLINFKLKLYSTSQ